MPAKVPVRFTTEYVQRLKPQPPKTQIMVWDAHPRGHGLVLTVGSGGARTWSAHYYQPSEDKPGTGSSKYYKLGRFPRMSLQEARTKAAAFRADPQGWLKKDAENRRRDLQRDADDRRAESNTLEEAAEAIADIEGSWYFTAIAWEFLDKHKRNLAPDTHREYERILTRYVVPKWDGIPIHKITPRHVEKLIEDVERWPEGRKKPLGELKLAQASRTLAVVSRLFNWYAGRSKAPRDFRSPVLKGVGSGKSAERDRVLNPTELRVIWHACDDAPGIGPFIKLLLLTAQRKEKVQSMRWADIDFTTRQWTIPKSKGPRPKGTGGILKLPDVAMQIISQQTRREGNPFVFASPLTSGYFRGWAYAKDRFEERLSQPIEPWTFHDLRRTSRTLMGRARVLPDIAERVLGHARGPMEKVYDRWTYLDQKAEALAILAAQIAEIVGPPEPTVSLPAPTPDNVIHFPAQAQA